MQKEQKGIEKEMRMTIFWGKRGKICMKKNRINKRMEKNFTNKD